jgi:UDP-N-acetylmuramoyl-tripeptide--D-alanyl-D-alanine ligase
VIVRASEWTSGEVAAAVGGRLYGDAERRLGGVATDSRDPLADQLFVALVGERFDAHEFLDQVIDKGAGALLISRTSLKVTPESRVRWSAKVPLIEVDDSERGLGDLAKKHRQKLSTALVHAITGSNGKTSTKEMLAAILESAGSVLKTEGNLNNLIGLPMTLLGAKASHRSLVLEMGMNARGEIARLVEIADPDVGLITNVGPAHVGELGSIEAVAEAKGEMYAGLDRRRAIAVVNLDDTWITEMAARAGINQRRTFGRHADADVRVVARTPLEIGQRVELSVDGRTILFDLPYPGAHNALNAAAAVATATARTTLDPEAIARGLAAAHRVSGRLIVEPLGPYWIVDDCYNANAASMLAAIDTIRERVESTGGRLVALLGEMRELGVFSDEEHARVGAACAAARAAIVAAFGPNAGPIAAAARAGGVSDVSFEAEDVEALLGFVVQRLRAGDVILVKGSRGIHMERFIARLKEVVR